MPRNPETTWKMLDVAMSHYQDYIASKKDRCSLSFIDLLHTSNFKGGNASVTEPVAMLSLKIIQYETVLRKIDQYFSGRSLSTLTNEELKKLVALCNEFLELTKKEDSQIRGLGPSYASAILAAHFLDLIPVLDRRALNGAGIEVINSSKKQVKNIVSHYESLIRAFHSELCKRSELTVRKLDSEWFAVPLD